jgi:ubiquinone biosynthesis protein UbiJ
MAATLTQTRGLRERASAPWHADAGRLDTRCRSATASGIGYDAEETRETTTALAELQDQVDDQQAALDRLAEQLDALEAKP